MVPRMKRRSGAGLGHHRRCQIPHFCCEAVTGVCCGICPFWFVSGRASVLSVSVAMDRPEVGDCERGDEDRGGGAISSWGSFGIFAAPEELSSRQSCYVLSERASATLGTYTIGCTCSATLGNLCPTYWRTSVKGFLHPQEKEGSFSE